MEQISDAASIRPKLRSALQTRRMQFQYQVIFVESAADRRRRDQTQFCITTAAVERSQLHAIWTDTVEILRFHHMAAASLTLNGWPYLSLQVRPIAKLPHRANPHTNSIRHRVRLVRSVDEPPRSPSANSFTTNFVAKARGQREEQ